MAYIRIETQSEPATPPSGKVVLYIDSSSGLLSAKNDAGVVSTFTTLPTTSAALAAVISDETGSGSLVFADSPVFTTPNIGTATGSITGNAATATALQTARTINGVAFDGTANINIAAPQNLYVSSDQTITSGGALTLAHGLGAQPRDLRLFLICQSDESGYTAGQVVLANNEADDGQDSGLALAVDATNIYIRFGARATVFKAINFSTGVRANLTNANWKLRVIAATGL